MSKEELAPRIIEESKGTGGDDSGSEKNECEVSPRRASCALLEKMRVVVLAPVEIRDRIEDAPGDIFSDALEICLFLVDVDPRLPGVVTDVGEATAVDGRMFLEIVEPFQNVVADFVYLPDHLTVVITHSSVL